jgi:hypothetical protein
MSESIDREISVTFRRAGRGFVSRSSADSGTYIPAPPYVIAVVARKRVAPGAALSMPHIAPGYEAQVLEEYEERYGYYGVDVPVSPKRAGHISEIGKQILALDKQGKIRPPLDDREKQTIGHMIAVVAK